MIILPSPKKVPTYLGLSEMDGITNIVKEAKIEELGGELRLL
jgi:hypothetical protein